MIFMYMSTENCEKKTVEITVSEFKALCTSMKWNISVLPIFVCLSNAGADFVKYGVFLPPNKHLLISVTSQNDYVIMKLITDFYQSLLFIRQLI